MDIFEQTEFPTDWVSPIVGIQKNSELRICVDYTKLNKAVKRSHFPIGTVEMILAQLKGSKYFTKLDPNSGSYHIKHSKES